MQKHLTYKHIMALEESREDQDSMVRAHLAGCDKCRRQVEEQQRIASLISNQRKSYTSSDFTKKIMDNIKLIHSRQVIAKYIMLMTVFTLVCFYAWGYTFLSSLSVSKLAVWLLLDASTFLALIFKEIVTTFNMISSLIVLCVAILFFEKGRQLWSRF